MSWQLLVSLGVEGVLVVLSSWMLGSQGRVSRRLGGGFLVMTFCWSIIVGCVVALSRYHQWD